MKRQWSDQEVEELIRRAVSRSVPDIYRQVAAQQVPPLINEDHIVPPPLTRRRKRWPFVLAGLVVVAVGILLYLLMSTAAIISIGSGRDVELSVNRFERVLSVHSNSEAGAAILSGQSLANQGVDEALEQVFTAMAEQGYLDGLEQLPVQVDGGSWQYNRTLTSAAQAALERGDWECARELAESAQYYNQEGLYGDSATAAQLALIQGQAIQHLGEEGYQAQRAAFTRAFQALEESWKNSGGSLQ